MNGVADVLSVETFPLLRMVFDPENINACVDIFNVPPEVVLNVPDVVIVMLPAAVFVPDVLLKLRL